MANNDSTQTAKWLGLFLMLSSLPLAFITGLYVLAERFSTDVNTTLTAVFTAYVVSAGSLAFSGAGLMSGRVWARRIALIAVIIGLPVVTFVLYRTGLTFIGLFALPHLVAGFVLTMPAFDVSRNYDEVRAPRLRRRYLLVGTMFMGLALALVFGEDEIREMAWDLRFERWQSQCKATGEAEVCGRWALHQVFWSDDPDEMRAGLARFDSLCATKKVHRACEYAAKLRSSRHLEWMYGAKHKFFEQRRSEAARQCRQSEDEPDACVVAAWLRTDLRDEDAARKACANDDGAGCIAMVRFVDEVRRAACKGGYGANCAGPPGCREGFFAACDASKDPLEQALAVLDDASKSNPALYGARVEIPEDVASCEGGAALTCFAEGLNGTADVNPFAEPLPMRSLDVSLGRACELGHGVSCYVFALRILDQREPPADQTKRARALLDAGCEHGVERACWVAVLLDDPRNRSDYRERAQSACEQAISYKPACAARDHAIAYDLGIEPILVAESDAYRRMRSGCWDAGDSWSCVAGAEVMLESGRSWMPAVPPLLVQGSRLAESACRAGRGYGCKLLFQYASLLHPVGMTKEEKLREKICPQVPGACDD